MKSWKLKEIVMMSVLSVVFAVIYLLFLQLGNVLTGFMGPMGYEVIFGIWFIVSVIAANIIRKPGAAVLAEVVASIVELLIGNAVGPRLILSGFIQGLGAELVFAASRYKRFGTPVLMAAGMGSAVTSFIWGYFISGFAALAPGYVAAMFAVRLVSGALLAGLLGKWICGALLKTGVLRGFAIASAERNQGRAGRGESLA
ncbi:ECF transporter S component [Brevibacillus sp. B_LB10_24]|uniref:ECF transporter S component n=1 Tax=Brevibacillus sp. B_LB10_24 TaxID=3380645 RepID=UPI0038B78E69